jgi:hypothetical protein
MYQGPFTPYPLPSVQIQPFVTTHDPFRNVWMSPQVLAGPAWTMKEKLVVAAVVISHAKPLVRRAFPRCSRRPGWFQAKGVPMEWRA